MNALLEWLGEGGAPVKQDVANDRAFICESCPENRELGWWDRIKSVIADSIKEMLEERSKMGLTVPNESKLGMCRACGCCIPLLVHTPVKHISRNMKPSAYKKHPAHCWKLLEIKELYDNS